MTGGWVVEHHRGPAADLHARPLPTPLRRSTWWLEVDRPALVLGSAQAADVVDRRAARAAGVEVVRRHSGGGAVLVAPGDVTWVDVLIPATDERWHDDVGRAFHWLGDAWVEALGALGVTATAHPGGLVRSRWSDLVCFAGLGAGEVVVDGAKVVGLAQRRTRAGARFQCALLHRWAPAELVALLALPAVEAAEAVVALGPRAAGVPVAGGAPAVEQALLAALDAR